MTAWLFFALSLWCALFTLNAFRPRYRPPLIAIVGFFAGWLTIELALHHLILQGVGVALLLYHGALGQWPGWVALAVTVVSWCGLGVCYRRSAQTRETAERALEEGLGADYRRRIEPRLAARLDQRPSLSELMIPWPIRPRDVERIKDITYWEVAGESLELDIYRSREHPTGCPTLLEIHGGGWTISDKREQALPLMYHLARRGWLCLSVNYRLCPKATLPEPLVDLKRAVKWIREEGAAYGADPSFIVATGGSAGGHLAALLALTAGDPRYQPGFEGVDTSVQGCVSFYGLYDLVALERHQGHVGVRKFLEEKVLKTRLSENPEAFEAMSPHSRITPEAPPFFVLHGDRDTLAPVQGARRFCEAFRQEAVAPLVYAELRGAQHAFEVFPSLRAALAIRAVARFLAYLESNRPPGPRPQGRGA